jgi:hypothetical protein
VLLGNKDGTFQPAKNYTLGALSNHAVLVDVNKDGKLDLVEDSGVALGKGDGTFGPLISLFGSTNTTGNMGVGPGFADGFAVGDFNGDGFPDIVTAGVVIGTLLGKGDGTFTFNGYSSEVSANGIAVGDFNGDNALDVVYYSTDYLSGDAEVGILLGDGKGAFTQQSGATGLSIYAYATALTIADFNGDGKNDVGVAVPGAGLFAVLLGDGNGSWTGFANFAASSGTSLSPGREIYPLSGIAVADVKRDGKPDVLLTGDLGFSRLINVSKRP